MEKEFIIAIGVISLVGFAFLFVPGSDSAIPPTPAFSQLRSGGQTINATTYNDNFTISTIGSISTSISGNLLTMRLVQKNCDTGEAVIGIAANGTIICGIP